MSSDKCPHNMVCYSNLEVCDNGNVDIWCQKCGCYKPRGQQEWLTPVKKESEIEHIKICTGCGTLESKPRDRHCCPDMRFKSFNELNIELERCKNRLIDSKRATDAILELQGQANAYHAEFIRALRRAEKAEEENTRLRNIIFQEGQKWENHHDRPEKKKYWSDFKALSEAGS